MGLDSKLLRRSNASSLFTSTRIGPIREFGDICTPGREYSSPSAKVWCGHQKLLHVREEMDW